MRQLYFRLVLPLVLPLVLVTFTLAQQSDPQTNPPSGSTPPTFPPDTKAPTPTPKTDKTTDTKDPDARPLTSQETKIQIVKKLQTQPGLSSKDINVKVTKHTIALNGSVPTENERTLADRIAQSYVGERKVENRLTVSTETPTKTK